MKEERCARGGGKNMPLNIPLIFVLLLALMVELKVVGKYYACGYADFDYYFSLAVHSDADWSNNKAPS